MENTQSLTPAIHLDWWTSKCRKLVFSTLNSMQDAYVEIQEANSIYQLGNTKASLTAKIVVLDSSLYNDFVKGGSIGAAEAYIEHKWTSPNLTKLIQIFARHQQQLDKVEASISWPTKIKNKVLHLANKNSQTGSKKNILSHYDLGNHLYKEFLDPTMMYSAAIYNQQSQTLEAAQNNKLKTICDKLELKSSDHLVEIGTGWGSLAIYAATNYGCKVTTTTISDAQFDYAQQQVKKQNLSKQITLLKKDYRELTGTYDKLVSIEMIEAVGHDYLPTFFKKCDSLLNDSGKMLLQAITIADNRYDHYRKNVDFIQRYIFPGGCLPSIQVISKQFAEQSDMVIDHVEDIGLHYARTLNQWYQNFNQNWAVLAESGFDAQFKRLWNYYLCYCEGAFLERAISTHHITARKLKFVGRNDAKVLAY
ncbi:cyclopropane-fatty-acyl-phospholipid synthase family protein [Paraglaciecola sp. L3A3]|uniref:SAM-dependent methyltransferase n=1 Tax=Paraglaciecola sp. L3A3 TaxID=2686358 RepID=UPI00131E4F5D|nr:cyclopropane-fatty-acyl-phospholipid synthase family protein [Paraglaciecola sp. L3A3]